MTGLYVMRRCGRQIGSVMRFEGNKRAERWVAYSIHGRTNPNGDGDQRSFPTRKAAAAWLAERDAQEVQS